jgi:hypothetical protein
MFSCRTDTGCALCAVAGRAGAQDDVWGRAGFGAVAEGLMAPAAVANIDLGQVS